MGIIKLLIMRHVEGKNLKIKCTFCILKSGYVLSTCENHEIPIVRYSQTPCFIISKYPDTFLQAARDAKHIPLFLRFVLVILNIIPLPRHIACFLINWLLFHPRCESITVQSLFLYQVRKNTRKNSTAGV